MVSRCTGALRSTAHFESEREEYRSHMAPPLPQSWWGTRCQPWSPWGLGPFSLNISVVSLVSTGSFDFRSLKVKSHIAWKERSKYKHHAETQKNVCCENGRTQKRTSLPPATLQMCKAMGKQAASQAGSCVGLLIKQPIVFSIKERKQQTHSLNYKNKHNKVSISSTSLWLCERCSVCYPRFGCLPEILHNETTFLKKRHVVI